MTEEFEQLRADVERLKTQVESLRADLEQQREKLAADRVQLSAETESLRRARAAGVTCKVSGKGAVSVYGLGRFPVTLYREQWERLLQSADHIRGFINDNAEKLKRKEAGASKAEDAAAGEADDAAAAAPEAGSES